MTDDNDTPIVAQWFEDNGLTGVEFRKKLAIYFGLVGVGFGIGVICTVQSVQAQSAVTVGSIGAEYHITHEALQHLTQQLMGISMAVFAPLLLYAAWVEFRGGGE